MPKIAELYNYPVAGMQGSRVETLTVHPESIEGNRSFALVLETELEHFFLDPLYIPLRMTQVSFPELVLFKTEIINNVLTLSYNEERFNTQQTVLASETTKPYFTNIKENHTLATVLSECVIPFRVSRRSNSKRWAIDCGEEVSQWLSMKLDTKVRLVKAVKNNLSPKHHFTWYSALHLITQASLTGIHLESQTVVDPRTMRANVLITETQAFEENFWQHIVMGGVTSAIELCERCGYIAIDQETGQKAKHMNVLTTISKNHDLKFGVYAQAEQTFTINVNDDIVVFS